MSAQAKEKEKTNVFLDPSKNEAFFKKRVGMGESFDLGVRKVFVLDREIQLYYVNGLCDTQYIIHLLRELVHLDDAEKNQAKQRKLLKTGC